MMLGNQTSEIWFILLMFSDLYWVNILLSLLLLTIYLVTVMANFLLILLRITDTRLHTPMYFFLSNLSFVDICLTTTITPKMLISSLKRENSISFPSCAMQMYMGLSLGGTECLLLAIMAYDRYVAICKPLRYHSLMSRRICFLLVTSCWICGLVNSFLHTVFTFNWPFCKSREIQHFYCEIQPLLRLSCADTHTHEKWIFASTLTIVVCFFLLTMLSYIPIISSILKMHSSEGKSKLFSTCSSHLLVVIIFYGGISSVYLRPISRYTPERDRIFSLLYTFLIPLCNPLIYSMRNKEVKGALSKMLEKASNMVKT